MINRHLNQHIINKASSKTGVLSKSMPMYQHGHEMHITEPPFFHHNSVIQKQPSRGVHNKRCSENMQQIYKRTPMPKYNFNKRQIKRKLYQKVSFHKSQV